MSSASWLTASSSANSATGGYVTTVTATAGSSMAATDYNGTIIVTGSSFAADNKQISVLLHVTTQPIAQASSSYAVASTPRRDRKPQTVAVGVTDAGQGTLTVSGVTATAASSGTWLTAATRERRHHSHGRSYRAFARHLHGHGDDREQWRQRQPGHPGPTRCCCARARRSRLPEASSTMEPSRTESRWPRATSSRYLAINSAFDAPTAGCQPASSDHAGRSPGAGERESRAGLLCLFRSNQFRDSH